MGKKRKVGFWQNVWRYKALILMALPGFVWFIFFFYIPVFANIVAFKDFHISPNGFIDSLISSKWIG
ncbi:sugar ABC transporter permease, partial [Enterococcus cecorum]|nr:sugar ABC transporter permease [Enterococcus cecorum]